MDNGRSNNFINDNSNSNGSKSQQNTQPNFKKNNNSGSF